LTRAAAAAKIAAWAGIVDGARGASWAGVRDDDRVTLARKRKHGALG